MGMLPGASLVGVDGGASTVRAWPVVARGPGTLAVEEVPLPRHRDFTPLPLARQLALLGTEPLRLPAPEAAAAALVRERTLEAVVEAAGPTPLPLVLGVCMPGLTDEAGQSVLVVRNGPRLPRFLDGLVAGLAARGLEVLRPPPRIVADGRAAGWGEEVAPHGRLRDVQNALYVAGGTGVAEALKRDGAFPRADEVRRWLEPAWRLRAVDGTTYEDLISMAGINASFHARRGTAEGPRVEEAARSGDETARRALEIAAEHLADFLFTRLETLHRHGEPDRDGAIERIVLGQRTADLDTDAELAAWFANPLRNHLAKRLLDAEDSEMQGAYLEGNELRSTLLVSSTLHAAPALGAVAVTLGMVEDGT